MRARAQPQGGLAPSHGEVFLHLLLHNSWRPLEHVLPADSSATVRRCGPSLSTVLPCQHGFRPLHARYWGTGCACTRLAAGRAELAGDLGGQDRARSAGPTRRVYQGAGATVSAGSRAATANPNARGPQRFTPADSATPPPRQVSPFSVVHSFVVRILRALSFHITAGLGLGLQSGGVGADQGRTEQIRRKLIRTF